MNPNFYLSIMIKKKSKKSALLEKIEYRYKIIKYQLYKMKKPKRKKILGWKKPISEVPVWNVKKKVNRISNFQITCFQNLFLVSLASSLKPYKSLKNYHQCFWLISFSRYQYQHWFRSIKSIIFCCHYWNIVYRMPTK